MAKARIEKFYTWTLVLNQPELRRICAVSQDAIRKTGADNVVFSFEMRFSDGSSYQTSVLDELFTEENRRSRAIIGLSMLAEANDSRIILEFCHQPDVAEDESANGNCSLVVEGPDRQWVNVTLSTLEDRLQRAKQWYPRSGLFRPTVLIVGCVLLYWTMKLLDRKYSGILWETGQAEKSTLTRTGLVVVLTLIAIYVVGLCQYVKWCFPDVVFRIGDGETRHDKIRRVRSKLLWIAIGTAGVGTAVGFVRDLFR